jgi:hypothetical protein
MNIGVLRCRCMYNSTQFHTLAADNCHHSYTRHGDGRGHEPPPWSRILYRWADNSSPAMEPDDINNPPLVPIVSQMNPFHALLPCYFRANSNTAPYAWGFQLPTNQKVTHVQTRFARLFVGQSREYFTLGQETKWSDTKQTSPTQR